MPFVNIPDTNLAGTIGKLVGKLEGDISGKAIVQANKLQSKFRSEGCPADLGRIRQQKNGIDQATSAISGRLSKFTSLPGKLKGPLGGLKAALKIILSLPIPQAVPPGIGLPINITTVYADIMHLLKEFVKQIGDTVDALEAILKAPSGQLKSIARAMAGVEIALKTCEIEKAIRDKLNEGAIDEKDLADLGLLNDENDLIFADLSPKFIGLKVSNDGIDADNRSVAEISQETGKTVEEVADILKKNKQILEEQALNNALGRTTSGTDDLTSANSPGGFSDTGLINAEQTKQSEESLLQLINSLDAIADSNIGDELILEIKSLVDLFNEDSDEDKANDDKFKHTGPDGTVYDLEILQDPESPSIAPRRFAIAKNPAGIAVLKGPKSFSSSVDILLDEIKFRIDNQLP